MGKAILFVRSTAAPPLDIRPASLDIAAIMRLERVPGYELCVGRSEEAEHRAMLASAAYAYRVGVDPDGATQAFAILSGLNDPHSNLHLKRIAAARVGEGLGTAFLALVLDEAFGTLDAIASSSTASPTTPGLKTLMRSSASTATASSAKPTASLTGRERTLSSWRCSRMNRIGGLETAQTSRKPGHPLNIVPPP